MDDVAFLPYFSFSPVSAVLPSSVRADQKATKVHSTSLSRAHELAYAQAYVALEEVSGVEKDVE